MRHVAANLRHELHKVLQYIVMQAEEIDEKVSLRRVDIKSPASRIVGATVILDHFIQMISGVYDFNPDQTQSLSESSAPIQIDATVCRFLETYSLIKNTRRAAELSIGIQIPDDLRAHFLPSVIEYIIALLCDNIWKYADTGTPVIIRAESFTPNLTDLVFINIGPEVPLDKSIFSKGYQKDPTAEGFGFGLYWSGLLTDHYNRLSGRTTDLLEILHHQESIPSERSLLAQTYLRSNRTPRVDKVQHTFRLRNILTGDDQ